MDNNGRIVRGGGRRARPESFGASLSGFSFIL
jgi:hypothetical protein